MGAGSGQITLSEEEEVRAMRVEDVVDVIFHVGIVVYLVIIAWSVLHFVVKFW